MDFECIVVGAGPAGLSAALTLGRARRHTLVLDSGKPRNHAARAMHGVLGHDGLSPAALKARGIEEVGRYGIEVRSADVSEARALDGGGFEIDGITADTLILATGMLDDTPPVDGFAEPSTGRIERQDRRGTGAASPAAAPAASRSGWQCPGRGSGRSSRPMALRRHRQGQRYLARAWQVNWPRPPVPALRKCCKGDAAPAETR